MSKGPVSQFIEHHYRHFNAAALVDAAKGYETHLLDGGKMLVSLAGAMSTAELGISLAEMIRQDKIAIISCTGANLEEDVMNLSEVQECYCVSGHSDFLLKIVVADMDEYREFILHKLASIKNIGNAQSHFVMNEVENEHFMPWISNSLPK